MKKTAILIFTIFMNLPFTARAQHQTIDEKMLLIDRAMIHALSDLKNGNMTAAKKSTSALGHRWDLFNLSYRNRQRDNEDWTESFRKATVWLNDGLDATRVGDRHGAFIFIDHFRYELMLIRFRMDKYDYYMDDIWDLEAAITVLAETVDYRDFCGMDGCELDELIVEINMIWQKIYYSTPDLKAFDLKRDDMNLFILHKEELGKAITHLLTLNDDSTDETIKKMAAELEERYWEFVRRLAL